MANSLNADYTLEYKNLMKWNFFCEIYMTSETPNQDGSTPTENSTPTEIDQQLLSSALHNCQNAILLCNANYPENNVIYVNEAFENLTGYKKSDISNTSSFFLFGNDRDQPDIMTLQNALERKQAAEVVLRCYRHDGSTFWGQFYVSPIEESTGKINQFLFIIINITSRNLDADKLTYYSTHDPLTDLPNRALLLDRLEQAIAFSKRYGMNIAILLIDLDHFQEFNKKYDSPTANTLLQAVGARLLSNVRENDTVARISADRFAVILTSLVGEENYLTPLKRLQTNLAEPLYIKNKETTFTCGIGISLYPKNGKDAYTLLKNADVALHDAKKQGPGQVQLYGADIKSLSLEEIETIKGGLSKAITDNELLLHYQPIIDLHSQKIVGMEALVRWRHPMLGLLPPGTFIPIAEESDQILNLNEWVLKTACQQNKTWQDSGLEPIPISVNLSKLQVIAPNTISSIIQILKETKLNPKYLEVEFSGNIMLEYTRDITVLMLELKALGIVPVIDNFGIKNSDLSKLVDLPMQKIKLDRELIKSLSTSPENVNIVKSVVAFAKNLKIRTLAEGVETKEQFELLKQLQIDEAQGFLFKPPLTAQVCAKLLLENPTLNP